MKTKRSNNLVIGIYFHPEAFPPTLNAVGELSECFDKITIVHRPHLKTEWEFPANIEAIRSGSFISSSQQELASLPRKIAFFLTFVRSLLAACRRNDPSMILVYDSISLLAYRMIRPFINKQHQLWYHNHDVSEWESLRKYSIGWLAGKTEAQMFPLLDIFSLPTNDRRKYFPMEQLKGKYFFIPNYPSRRFYKKFYQPRQLSNPLRLIFQGSIGPYHGIEQIIPLLKTRIAGYSLQLVLKGPCKSEYKELYTRMAKEFGVADRLFFAGVTAYAHVPETAATCHIGIGILAKDDLMNTTLGTASNKLYEYAAVGLPVLYYNSPSFIPYLRDYSWAIPVSLDPNEITHAIEFIIGHYETLSLQAHTDFENKLNFEAGFKEVKQYLLGVTHVEPKTLTAALK